MSNACTDSHKCNKPTKAHGDDIVECSFGRPVVASRGQGWVHLRVGKTRRNNKPYRGKENNVAHPDGPVSVTFGAKGAKARQKSKATSTNRPRNRPTSLNPQAKTSTRTQRRLGTKSRFMPATKQRTKTGRR